MSSAQTQALHGMNGGHDKTPGKSGLSTLLLAGDTPDSKTLTTILLLILVCLAGAPFLFPGTVAYRAASTICIFVLLAASYDMLLGYTAIVSFAHTMFYGIGAYGVAITLQYLPHTWSSVFIGAGAGLALSLALALVIGIFSLRVRTIFFAMVTLAVASAFVTLVSKLYHITGGEDGLNVMVPALISPANRFLQHPLHGFDIFGWLGSVVAHPGQAVTKTQAARFVVQANGALCMYYLLFASMCGLFLLMLRLVNSPFGRVLQAIRENEFRAQALGYRTVLYRTAITCISALIASAAGSLLTLSLQYIDPDTTLSFTLMINILVMTVIGGMGTLYGAVLGATIFVIAENYLRASLQVVTATPIGHIPVIGNLLSPDRWPLWLGLLFVLSVYFFPQGIVGQLRKWAH